ncbi:DMT family transporter [Paraburkholderia sp. 2C]
MNPRFGAISTALAAAVLFGAATPLAKVLLGAMSPFMVAGLFYLGSGIGLFAVSVVRRLIKPSHAGDGHREPPGSASTASTAGSAGSVGSIAPVSRAEWPWFLGAIAAGGIAGPALLMLGLWSTPAATTALLLNLEGVLTAVIAWVVFRENVDIPVFLGMVAIVAGGVVLSWQPGDTAVPLGALLIIGACLCWAIDNNLTRKVSTNDAMAIASVKGLIAGPVNLAIAFATGASWPPAAAVAAAMLTGLVGYGVSLVLFVVALRHLGTARTGAYFSVAPLFGVALSLLLWPEWPHVAFWVAAVLMTIGIVLHMRERHEHEHTHDWLEHTHRHVHDAHHRHEHDTPYEGDEPHTHRHVHPPITHSHAHFPDVHHRHRH